MKVSLNWIKEFTKVDLPVDELVAKIGAQLGAVEEVIDNGRMYHGIIVAKVMSCEDHPNADKLHVCKIDDGGVAKTVERDENGYVQVVCGAPNVREGLMVAWLPPGVVVPATIDKDPFLLEARELRGVVSYGMLASAAELAISDDHSGILELNPDDAKPGADFVAAFKLDDYIIDIENKMFTHRPDCFGILGVAREIAGITNQKFTSPKWYQQPEFPAVHSGLELTVKNELPKLVPRFMVVPMRVTSNGPSPAWLQTYLARVGLRPINTIVDITNYVMMLTGQPLHAYDYDKVKALSDGAAQLTVRYPKKGEKIKLLSGKEIVPRPEAIMIATDKTVIGVGGVMGGADTEVDENTKSIILECASFDMYSIRRTSMEHGLFTDAVTRFNKGQSSLQNDRVLAFAASLIVQLTDGTVAGKVQDKKVALPTPSPIIVTADFINNRLGLNLKAKAMATLLHNVEFEAYTSGEELTIAPPFWRTDIEIKEDVVEEVGRLYGFDKLPVKLPTRTIRPTHRNTVYDLKAKIRDVLSRFGANEVLTYSFVHGDLLQKTGQPADQAYELSNALSPDLQYFRMSLMPSLLDKVHANIKAGTDEFAIFEINKAHTKAHAADSDENVPKELPMLGFVYSASDKADHPAGAAYYQAVKYLTDLLVTFGIRPAFGPLPAKQEFPITQPYDPKRSAYVTDANSGQFLGIIGEFKLSVARNLKLPRYTAGFEIGLEDLMEASLPQRPYVPLPRFPSVQQDITLKVSAKHDYQTVMDCLLNALVRLRPDDTFPRLTPVSIYQPDGANAKNISFRLKIAAYNRTLKTEEVNSLLDKLAAQAGQEFGAERL